MLRNVFRQIWRAVTCRTSILSNHIFPLAASAYMSDDMIDDKILRFTLIIFALPWMVVLLSRVFAGSV